MGKMDGYRDMAMYLSVMYQAACYDADGVLEDGGWANLCASQTCGLLRSTTSSQVGRQDLIHGWSRLMGMRFQ